MQRTLGQLNAKETPKKTVQWLLIYGTKSAKSDQEASEFEFSTTRICSPGCNSLPKITKIFIYTLPRVLHMMAQQSPRSIGRLLSIVQMSLPAPSYDQLRHPNKAWETHHVNFSLPQTAQHRQNTVRTDQSFEPNMTISLSLNIQTSNGDPWTPRFIIPDHPEFF